MAGRDRLFGTDGIRGVANVELTPELAFAVGRAGAAVLAHSSDRHPWFVDARSSRRARHRDWYVWADPKPGGSPPNNWLSVFGGPAWTLDEQTGQCYLHTFLPSQPDLNWWKLEVRSEFDSVVKQQGIDGLIKTIAQKNEPAAVGSSTPKK